MKTLISLALTFSALLNAQTVNLAISRDITDGGLGTTCSGSRDTNPEVHHTVGNAGHRSFAPVDTGNNIAAWREVSYVGRISYRDGRSVMFERVGEQATKNIADALPGVEKTITDAFTAVQVLVGQTLVPIIADVITQALAQVDRLDGATVSIEPDRKLTATVTVNVSVDVPTFTARVNMPLKP